MDDLRSLPLFKIDYKAFREQPKPKTMPLPELEIPRPPSPSNTPAALMPSDMRKPSISPGIKPGISQGMIIIPWWALIMLLIAAAFITIILGYNGWLGW